MNWLSPIANDQQGRPACQLIACNGRKPFKHSLSALLWWREKKGGVKWFPTIASNQRGVSQWQTVVPVIPGATGTEDRCCYLEADQGRNVFLLVELMLT